MKTILTHAAIRSLCAALIAGLIALGAFAIHLTHISAIVTVSFGEVEKFEPIKIPAVLTRVSRR